MPLPGQAVPEPAMGQPGLAASLTGNVMMSKGSRQPRSVSSRRNHRVRCWY